MSKMTQKAVRRIQSHADRTGTNQGFKARVQSAYDRRMNQPTRTPTSARPKKK